MDQNKIPKKTCTVQIFPDSGAGICLAGTQHLKDLNITTNDLIPCKKKVMAVGGSTLTCRGWLPVKFKIGSKTTQQPLYFCDRVDRIYFSREGCTAVDILPPTFPYPMNEPKPTTETPIAALHEPRVRPKELPFPGTEENISKLKDHLVNEFPNVFRKSTPFRTMNCKPVHIHLKNNATPSATHVPIPIPVHWKEAVKKQLDEDIKNGIIEQVPIGDPVEWCSPMVVTAKKDGTPRRTVDLQKLNRQCRRETHHVQSPFQLACKVPPNTKRTILDATDGYHAIPLDEASKPLTTFITEWGRFRYCRLPQGFLAAGDAYTRRYDEIIKDVPDKIKCVDDALLYDKDITGNYFHTWDYLYLCEQNGITLNLPKFIFCQDEVDFGGLHLTKTGICPSEKTLSAIKEFPTPKDITGARSWFGLVNQVAWAYSNTEVMQPFRELVKPKSKFYWDDKLETLFRESKEILIKQSTEGIQTFDTRKNTCLQTDWSRDGIGYLLLQQECDCAPSKAPVCCKDGWKLVLAGSRFTKGAETRYSPTEGEALAVAWSLDHARLFVLGCQNLIVSSDHKPLEGILRDRDLSTILNPRLQNLRQRTLPYTFKTQYNPGRWHRAPDALSRFPAKNTDIVEISLIEEEEIDKLAPIAMTAFCAAIQDQPTPSNIITIEEIKKEALNDEKYMTLLTLVKAGFPEHRGLLQNDLKEYWNVKDRLSYEDNLVMMDQRIVIPNSLRRKTLQNLHSAHQGASSMIRRASYSIYWPGMNAAIHNTRFNCQLCNELTPSQKNPIAQHHHPHTRSNTSALITLKLGTTHTSS